MAEPAAICVACGTEMPGPRDELSPPGGCKECTQRLPASLIKACYDLFDYALGLTNGMVIRFSKATVTGDYVELTVTGDWAGHGVVSGLTIPARGAGDLSQPYTPSFDRGIDVRIDQIVWCADAPDGS